MPPGERAGLDPAAALAGQGAGAGRPAGQASDLQPGQQSDGIRAAPSPGGHGQLEQHCQATRDRGGQWAGPQPQQAQAQAHQLQHAHTPTARCTTGWPGEYAHRGMDAGRAIPDPLACLTLLALVVAAVRRATWLDEPAAAVPRAPAAWPARGPLPAHAVVNPMTRTAITPSTAPARPDRARTCDVVIAPSRHRPGSTHLTQCGRDRFHPLPALHRVRREARDRREHRSGHRVGCAASSPTRARVTCAT